MSHIYIVTCELVSPGVNYDKLVGRIKNHCTSWARIGAYGYLIQSTATAVQMRDLLSPALIPNDKLFVGSCTAPSAWTGMPDDVSKWIIANQK